MGNWTLWILGLDGSWLALESFARRRDAAFAAVTDYAGFAVQLRDPRGLVRWTRAD